MLANALILAVALGLDGEQQVALDELIASRQAARTARLEAAAAERDVRMMAFSSKQYSEARERKSARQMRLVAMKSAGRTHWPTANLAMMQRAAISAALQRQFAPMQSGAFYGFDRR